MITNLRDTFEKYPEVWNVESHCNMVINKLVCVGTNLLLSFDDYVRNSDEKYNSMRGDIAYTACAIVVLENYDGNDDVTSAFNSQVSATKQRDLQYLAGDNVHFDSSSTRRDLLKFYSKRIACSCLKELHSVARKILSKEGECNHCEEVKERASLMVCSRCRVSQYCSRECQVASHCEHKERCDSIVRANEQQGGEA